MSRVIVAILAAFTLTSAIAPDAAHAVNLLTNGDFSASPDPLEGWTIWSQRGDVGGSFTPQVVDGVLHLRGTNFNGGVFQVVDVPPNVPLTVDGFWQSNPTVANYQWGEVIVVEGDVVADNVAPANGQDVTTPLIFKNHTFDGDGAWDGTISLTATQTNDPTGGPLGAGSPSGKVTVILKAGNLGGNLSGTNFDNIELNAPIPEPSTALLFVVGSAVLMLRRRRRRVR
ncbi:MAG: PEP-CTERM sorting domain-containing protein [Planctomycetes bacterium]|nr:PEP-CTERM sorting domain-containing protein [Planctomycetota bacterium]